MSVDRWRQCGCWAVSAQWRLRTTSCPQDHHYTTLHYTALHHTTISQDAKSDLTLIWTNVFHFVLFNYGPPLLLFLSALLCPALPSAVLCCAVTCCAVTCCAVLCCAVLCCAVLCCAVLCCAVLQCTFFSHTVLFLSACHILSLRPILSCPILLFNLITCTPHLSPFFFHSPLHSSPLHFTPRSSSQLCLAK